MAELKTSHKWIIVIVAIVVLLGIAWFIYKSIPAEEGGGAPPVDTTTTHPGLLELASGFVAGGWIKNLFGGGKKKVNCVSGCDQNAPGKDCNGFPSVDCGFGRVQK